MKKHVSLLLKFFICLALVLNAGCIHTQSHETKSFNVKSEDGFDQSLVTANSLQVSSIIYSEEKFPLDEFFSRLLKGEFTESFKRLSLRYKSSNTKNEVMQKLLASGLTPVYMSVTNNGTTDVRVSYKQFNLTDGTLKKSAFNPNFLPSEMKQFSPTALAANVYNITVVTVTVMIAILLASAENSHIPDFRPSGGKSFDNDNKILNPTVKTTRLDYKSYLITEQTLQPGEQIYGLVFFNRDIVLDNDRIRLEYTQ